MKLDVRFLSSLSLVAALSLGAGCPADEDPADTTADTDDGSSGTPTTGPSTDPTNPTATTGPTTDPTDTTDGTTSEGETTATTATTIDPTDPTGADPLPNGADCTMDDAVRVRCCYVSASADFAESVRLMTTATVEAAASRTCCPRLPNGLDLQLR